MRKEIYVSLNKFGGIGFSPVGGVESPKSPGGVQKVRDKKEKGGSTQSSRKYVYGDLNVENERDGVCGCYTSRKGKERGFLSRRVHYFNMICESQYHSSMECLLFNL